MVVWKRIGAAFVLASCVDVSFEGCVLASLGSVSTNPANSRRKILGDKKYSCTVVLVHCAQNSEYKSCTWGQLVHGLYYGSKDSDI